MFQGWPGRWQPRRKQEYQPYNHKELKLPNDSNEQETEFPPLHEKNHNPANNLSLAQWAHPRSEWAYDI